MIRIDYVDGSTVMCMHLTTLNTCSVRPLLATSLFFFKFSSFQKPVSFRRISPRLVSQALPDIFRTRLTQLMLSHRNMMHKYMFVRLLSDSFKGIPNMRYHSFFPHQTAVNDNHHIIHRALDNSKLGVPSLKPILLL